MIFGRAASTSEKTIIFDLNKPIHSEFKSNFMKKIGVALLLLLTLSFMTISCSKDDPGDVPTGPVTPDPGGPTGPSGG